MFKTVSNQQNRVFVFIPSIKKYSKFFLNNQNPFLSLLGNLCTVPKYLTEPFLNGDRIEVSLLQTVQSCFSAEKMSEKCVIS